MYTERRFQHFRSQLYGNGSYGTEQRQRNGTLSLLHMVETIGISYSIQVGWMAGSVSQLTAMQRCMHASKLYVSK